MGWGEEKKAKFLSCTVRKKLQQQNHLFPVIISGNCHYFQPEMEEKINREKREKPWILNSYHLLGSGHILSSVIFSGDKRNKGMKKLG